MIGQGTGCKVKVKCNGDGLNIVIRMRGRDGVDRVDRRMEWEGLHVQERCRIRAG